MNTTTTAINATPARLRNGSWGARVEGTVEVGATLNIRTKTGTAWTARVTAIVWSGNGVTLCATERMNGENITAIGGRQLCAHCRFARAVMTARDSSGIEGQVCQRCGTLEGIELSFA